MHVRIGRYRMPHTTGSRNRRNHGRISLCGFVERLGQFARTAHSHSLMSDGPRIVGGVESFLSTLLLCACASQQPPTDSGRNEAVEAIDQRACFQASQVTGFKTLDHQVWGSVVYDDNQKGRRIPERGLGAPSVCGGSTSVGRGVFGHWLIRKRVKSHWGSGRSRYKFVEYSGKSPKMLSEI